MYTLHAAIQYRLYHVHYDDSMLPRSHPSRCQIRSFCELHIDHLIPHRTSFSSFFLSLSASCSTPVSLPLIPGGLSIVVLLIPLVDCCLLVVCDCPLLMNLVIAFFLTVGAPLPYRMHVQYGLHGTVVSVHLRYSTVCTMLTVGASLPYRMRVRAASYDSLRAPVVHYRLYHAGTTIRSRCHIFFANSTLFTTSFLKLPCLPSSPPQLLALLLSRSLSFLVSLSIVVLSFLLIVVFFLSFAIHHDEYGDRCFSCCRCYRIVFTYSTGCTVRYYLCTRCTLSFVPCWNNNSIAVSHSFFLRTQHCSPLPSSNFLVFLPLPLSFLLYHCLAPSRSSWVWALLSCRSCWLLSSSCRLQFIMMNMVIAVFLAVVATVSYARTVRAAGYSIISAPAVHYRLYHACTTIWCCPVCISVSHSVVLQSPRTLTTLCWHLLFLFTLTLTTTFLFVLLSLYLECTSSSFYFAFCSKKWVAFSFLAICSRWVCQLSRIQNVLCHLREVLSSLSKSNHGVNTGMVCVLVDCQVQYRSAIHTLLRAQLLCAAKEGEGWLRFW